MTLSLTRYVFISLLKRERSLIQKVDLLPNQSCLIERESVASFKGVCQVDVSLSHSSAGRKRSLLSLSGYVGLEKGNGLLYLARDSLPKLKHSGKHTYKIYSMDSPLLCISCQCLTLSLSLTCLSFLP